MTEAQGFSDNPFMIGYDNRIFEFDDYLGFRFPQNRLIISNGFIDLENLLEQIKRNTGYITVLNIGDSSTSGWNGNKIFKGNTDINAPFFTYKTYSDLMKEQLFANVINAGVPGYSSLQGKKYLEKLLSQIYKAGVSLDYVTIYFGNNDCTYNKYEDKFRLDFKKESFHHQGERVSIQDYEKNLRSMIDIIREYGSKPVLIVPPVHYDWEPGIRSTKYRNEFETAVQELNNLALKEELATARKLFSLGRYKEACELDRVLPRIKERYRRIMIKVAKETNTPIIDVQNKIPLTNNSEYFVDYCHPTEKTNMLMVQKFREIITKDMFKKSLRTKLQRFLTKLFTKSYNKQDKDQPPQNIYSLY